MKEEKKEREMKVFVHPISYNIFQKVGNGEQYKMMHKDQKGKDLAILRYLVIFMTSLKKVERQLLRLPRAEKEVIDGQ